MNFQCRTCNELVTMTFKDGKFESPKKCAGKCKSKRFDALKESAISFDWQKVRVQENMSDEQKEPGRVPRTIECELVGSLVDSCIPGDIVTVTG